MTGILLAQLAIYELLDIVPCALLAAVPFRSERYSFRKMMVMIVSLYFMGVGRRLLSLYFPDFTVPLAILWIVMYLFAFKIVFCVLLDKLLFVLITILNYASIIAISYNYVGDKLFKEQLNIYPYCIEASIILVLMFFVSLPPFYYFLRNKIAPLMEEKLNDNIWRFLWMVPGTFCIFFYYNLYTDDSILAFSGLTRNFIFAMVISAGFFFVLTLVQRLIIENSTSLQLKIENQQLSMLVLQYESLQGRMEETRQARHDIRQCMAVIQSYLQTGDREELQQFAVRYCETLPDDIPITYFRNTALNAVICYYSFMAGRLQISFNAQIHYPELSMIQDTDLVVLFGNILENAVEACVRQQEGSRFIRLIVQPKGGMIVIALDNSYDGVPICNGEDLQSSKRKGIGIGLQSIRKITQRYGGVASFNGDGHVFSVSVLLNR